MSNRAVDAYLEHENYVKEVACVDCGFHRNGRAHPKIKCPHSGRCGECGNDWPCEEHQLPNTDLKDWDVDRLRKLFTSLAIPHTTGGNNDTGEVQVVVGGTSFVFDLASGKFKELRD